MVRQKLTPMRMNKNLKYTFGLLTALPILVSCATTASSLEMATEYPKVGEVETTQRLVDALSQSIVSRYEGRTVLRDAHPKHHGCVRATVEIPKLPEKLSVGLFNNPGTYPAWIRYSTASETVDSDKSKAMLGMAVKVMGVEGEKLKGDEKFTQDILLLSHPVLPIRNAEDFLEVVDEKIWFFINPLDPHFHELGIVLASKVHHTSPLDTRYWSTTPYAFGANRAVKYSAKPCPSLPATLPKTLSDDYLQSAMSEQLSSDSRCFTLMVQFQTNANTMPLEDASIVWDETISPFQKVATITIPSQHFESQAQMEFCENISMDPWHSLVEHRPLGSINRARKEVYDEISKLRHLSNEVKPTEPTGDEEF